MAYEFLKAQEGFRPRAYRDSIGIWTIGYGQTKIGDRPVRAGDIISQAQADKEWMRQIAPYLAEVHALGLSHLTAQQEEALLSLCYNIGTDNFKNSTLARRLCAGADNAELAEAWLRWNKAGGRISVPLLARRKRELAFYGINV